MAAPAEKDPTKGIVDIDTFTHYVRGYTSDILANSPRTVSIGSLGVRSHAKKIGVYLEDCPWETIPESIQAMIKIGYKAAELPETKYVDVYVGRKISFTLKSPSVKDGIDAYGESFISPDVGVSFMIGTIPEFDFLKGEWLTHPIPLAAIIQAKGKTLEEEMNIFIRTGSLSKIATFSHTLQQLHDLAKFLEQSRNRAVVYR